MWKKILFWKRIKGLEQRLEFLGSKVTDTRLFLEIEEEFMPAFLGMDKFIRRSGLIEKSEKRLLDEIKKRDEKIAGLEDRIRQIERGLDLFKGKFIKIDRLSDCAYKTSDSLNKLLDRLGLEIKHEEAKMVIEKKEK